MSVAKKYYKVIKRKYNGIICTYESLMMCNPQFCVTYCIDEWTYPKVKGTKLFVFDNLNSALLFSSSSDDVYEAEVKNPRPLKNYGLFNWAASHYSWKVVLQMLSLRKRKKRFMHLRVNESGMKNTVVVDAVKLIKQVKEY